MDVLRTPSALIQRADIEIFPAKLTKDLRCNNSATVQFINAKVSEQFAIIRTEMTAQINIIVHNKSDSQIQSNVNFQGFHI